MKVRRIALAATVAGLLFGFGVQGAPAVSPALLMAPTPTAVVTPVVRGPRIYKLPFPGGKAFDVCQGNNHVGGTHVGAAAGTPGTSAWTWAHP